MTHLELHTGFDQHILDTFLDLQPSKVAVEYKKNTPALQLQSPSIEGSNDCKGDLLKFLAWTNYIEIAI